ncbi:MAG: response regulator transcription factor [Tannerellaceae bacterium]|jgi:DNA-binding response OmpR family regulator|nr:response regulator transcription factor [Tannerellaceae bacterium]
MNNKEYPVVLLVEDETTLSSIITDTLESEGFICIKAFDGQEGLRIFHYKKPDILIADVMMPKMDGFEMVREIRKTDKTTPALFLTARSSIEDLVSGFELGANDYLRKPFKMQELIVRIKALLNRVITNKPVDNTVFGIGSYIFDSTAQTLGREGKSEQLTHFENKILKRLCIGINHVTDAQSLLLDLWYDDSPYNRNSLHGYIHKLRKLLSKDERVKIINVRGIGYKLVCKSKQFATVNNRDAGNKT